MRYLIFVSLLFMVGCSKTNYKDKKEVTLTKTFTAADFRPDFEKVLYRCEVNGKFALKKFHLSGILYIKNFDDKNTRVIFQSEMGATLFDFGWNANDSFQVYAIIDQMNKAALIKTLQKDFELLLVKKLNNKPEGDFNFDKNPDIFYTKFNLEKGFVYYVTNRSGKLISIENADDKQKVVLMKLGKETPLKTLPEALKIKHLRAGFTIDLKQINQDQDASE